MNKIFIVLMGLLFASGAWGQAREFTFGTIPDTQNLTELDLDHKQLTQMTQFYADKKDSLNLVFVASLGDMTQWGAPDQWQRVRESYNVFENTKIPYAPCQGNHDSKQEDFKKWFPVSDFETNLGSFYCGSFNSNMANAYYLFSEAGMDFIVVVLQTHDHYTVREKGYNWASIHWANYILSSHPNRRAILITHDFYENRKLIDYVITKHDNLFLAICGHSCDREKYWTENSPQGNKVHCVMTDYQCDTDKGATVRYYTFKPDEDIICAYTYNVAGNRYEKDNNSEFCFDYSMKGSGLRIKLTQDSKIREGEENGETLKVTLSNDAFVANLTHENWIIDSLPQGVSAGSICRINDTIATIELKGNSIIGSYNSDITDVTVTILKDELKSSKQFCGYQGITLTKAIQPLSLPSLIQAEEYTAMHGVQIGNTNDNGDEKNIGYLSPDDWVEYRVNVPKAGIYVMNFRTSSLNANGEMLIQINGKTIQSQEFKPTGGWHTWSTTSTKIELNAGVQELKFLIVKGNFNMNWFEITY